MFKTQRNKIICPQKIQCLILEIKSPCGRVHTNSGFLKDSLYVLKHKKSRFCVFKTQKARFLFSKNKCLILKIVTWTPILYSWSIEIPYRAHFWCRNSLVGWSSDSGCQGTGFDSRLVQVTFWSLFGHVGVTFSHFFGHVGMCLGNVVGHVRMGLGGFWEKVANMLENVDT